MQSTLHSLISIVLPGNPCKYQNKIFTFLIGGIKRHESRIYTLVEKYLKVLMLWIPKPFYDYPLKIGYLGIILKFWKSVQSLFTFLLNPTSPSQIAERFPYKSRAAKFWVLYLAQSLLATESRGPHALQRAPWHSDISQRAFLEEPFLMFRVGAVS